MSDEDEGPSGYRSPARRSAAWVAEATGEGDDDRWEDGPVVRLVNLALLEATRRPGTRLRLSTSANEPLAAGAPGEAWRVVWNVPGDAQLHAAAVRRLGVMSALTLSHDEPGFGFIHVRVSERDHSFRVRSRPAAGEIRMLVDHLRSAELLAWMGDPKAEAEAETRLRWQVEHAFRALHAARRDAAVEPMRALLTAAATLGVAGARIAMRAAWALGERLLELERPHDALAAFERGRACAHAAYGADAPAVLELAGRMAECHAAAGAHDVAIDLLRRAIDESDSNDEVLLADMDATLASRYADAGRADEARPSWDRAIARLRDASGPDDDLIARFEQLRDAR
ncbi:MAG: hypothetical protein AB7S26_21530 [Sandaracinaceae bacterium]